MRIEFLEVRWKNLLSYPNDFSTLSLDSHKTTLLCGVNGAGKSAILDVLSFALFNKPFRDINKPELVNEINNHDCLVELTFVVGQRKYLVRRGIRPSIFEIFEDGKLLNPRADAVDYQEILEKQIIRCGHRSFLQTVILGSGNYIPFMQLAAAQRREVVESLLGLKVFSGMQTVIKQGLAEVSAKMVDNRVEKAGLDKQIEIIAENRRLRDEYNDDSIKRMELTKSEMQENINKAEDMVRLYSGEVEPFQVTRYKMRDVEASIRKYAVVQSEMSGKKRSLDLEVAFLQDSKSCRACGQPIDDEFRVAAVATKREKIVAIEDASRKLESKVEELESHRLALGKDEGRRQELLRSIDNEKFHQAEWRKQILVLDEDIARLCATMAVVVSDETKNLEENAAALFKEYNRLEDENYQRSVALELVPFIKAAVVKKYIPFFNKQILFYMQKFDSSIRFTLNEHFEESIIYRGRDKLGYGSLSEGEKFRVNVAILFAWRAVARSRGSINCNLLFLDEIMDSSLDSEGVDSFMQIVRCLDDATCVYVISHREGDFADSFDRVVEVRKHSNFSRIQ